ncbi:MAG: hypothetical protein O2895_01645 [Chloroflexi bacterium]|nr:hypothetical protein [Chloroflexota bacterium]
MASGPVDPNQPEQMGVMLGRGAYATRDEADAAARAGAADRAAAGFGVARTVVIEAAEYADAIEAAYLELMGMPFDMPDEARRAIREASRGDLTEGEPPDDGLAP